MLEQKIAIVAQKTQGDLRFYSEVRLYYNKELKLSFIVFNGVKHYIAGRNINKTIN